MKKLQVWRMKSAFKGILKNKKGGKREMDWKNKNMSKM